VRTSLSRIQSERLVPVRSAACRMRAALALHFAAYNFTWMHSSIRMTPAMKAGLARKPWTVRNLLVGSA